MCRCPKGLFGLFLDCLKTVYDRSYSLFVTGFVG